MNIEKFVQRRKKLGYSQSELAKGICTQATISKFENNGKMISTKILTQLCQRLGLSLSDIFPSAAEGDAQVREDLRKAEFDLITTEYDEAQQILQEISIDKMEIDHTKMEYLFIKGYLLALSDANIDEAIFCFDQILNGYDESHSTIYSQLAYVGMGISYEHAGNVDKATFYFSKMPERLKKASYADIDTTWKVLTMLFYTGHFYAAQQDLVTSDVLLRALIEVSSKQHVTFYVARAQYQLALNLIAQKTDFKMIREALNDAYAFAKFNHNTKLIDKINQIYSKNRLDTNKEATQ